MRHRVLLIAAGCAVLLARIPQTTESSLGLINRLDDVIQARFQSPSIAALGMSRVAIPSSLGRHFRPNRSAQRDFEPENAVEKEVIQKLEDDRLQVGFYVFGAAILNSSPAALAFRALKGPAAITAGTPRPAFYPALVLSGTPAVARPDALPDWKAVYPLARKAMQSFHDGGPGFETTVDSWTIAARPVLAGDRRCVACHKDQALHQPIGGVLYAFRQAPASKP